MIVFNLLFLIFTNTLLTLSPIPPLLYLPLPLVEPVFLEEPSLMSLLRLPRIHTESQLKVAIREATKQYHPDKGGSQEEFERVKHAKKVLSYQNKPYDRLGITSFASDKPKDIAMQIENNTTLYFIEVGMFYIISLIFLMAVTYQLEERYLRKYTILALVLGVGLELYAFKNPEQPTIIDLLYDKIPLHRQFIIMRNISSILVAIILANHSRKLTRDKQLVKSLDVNNPQKLKESLEQLSKYYDDQITVREKYDKSIVSKIRNYFVKGLSLACLGMMIYSFVR